MPSHPFGLSENPFGNAYDPRFIFRIGKRVEMVALMRKRIADGESFVTLTGDPGCGKTSVVMEVLESGDLNAQPAFIAHPSLTPSELLEAVCIEFGAPLPGTHSKPQILFSLEHHLRELRRQGHIAVLVLDEAHGLKNELLEETRLLSNLEADGRGLLQTVLVGVPELERRLGLPELAQLRRRIAVHCRMLPLSPEETAGYVRHRLAVAGGNGPALFPDETCEVIHAYTNGFPRDINMLAGRSLEHAEEQGAPAVSADHVRLAAGDAHPGITTVQRAPAGVQHFELKRKATPGRAVVEAPRAPERPVEKPPAPAPEVRKPPSFLRTQLTARAGDPAVPAVPKAAAPQGPQSKPTLEERLRKSEVTADDLTVDRPGAPRPAWASQPSSPLLASEGVKELGASVLLAGLMVVVLVVSGQWNPVPPPVESHSVETAGAADPIEPLPEPPGAIQAGAMLDPGTPPAPALTPDVPSTVEPAPVPPMMPAPVPPSPVGGRQAYGFEVSSSNYADSAAAVLKRITGGSKVPCRIITKSTGDTYRVVVGPFASRLEAQRAINALFRTTLVKRAQLVQIPE